MDDTRPWARAQMEQLWRQRSPAERLAAAAQMFEDARILATAGLRHEHPDLSGDDFRLRLFERLYRADFSAQQWQWIVAEWRRRRALAASA